MCYALLGLCTLVVVVLALNRTIELTETHGWLFISLFGVAFLIPYVLAARDHYVELGKS